MLKNKKAYFQGGGGVNEPTPGKKKYKSDPALVVQPRFEEPFYRNYDLYTVPRMEHIGPGTGYHGLQNYKSVAEFLEARRKRLTPRYVADDSWQLDNGKRVKTNPNIQARASILERIVKLANLPKTAGPNYDLGKGLYQEMSDGKIDSVEEFREEGHHGPGAFSVDDNADYMMPPKEHGTKIYDWKNSPYQGKPKKPKMDKNKSDDNDIDFPFDLQRQDSSEEGSILGDSEYFEKPNVIGPAAGAQPKDGIIPGTVGLGDYESYPASAQIGGYLDKYLPQVDFEGKTPDQLDFGRDYTEDTGPSSFNKEDLDELANKYLSPAESDLFGMPDGMDPISDLDPVETEQVEQPYDTTSDIGTQMYTNQWSAGI